jgi:hypothetical protein
MTTQTPPTPTPWTVGPTIYEHMAAEIRQGKAGEPIGQIWEGPRAYANAELIVRAVNSHAALIEQVETWKQVAHAHGDDAQRLAALNVALVEALEAVDRLDSLIDCLAGNDEVRVLIRAALSHAKAPASALAPENLTNAAVNVPGLWQPIETAPKGEEVLVWKEGSASHVVAIWLDHVQCWVSAWSHDVYRGSWIRAHPLDAAPVSTGEQMSKKPSDLVCVMDYPTAWARCAGLVTRLSRKSRKPSSKATRRGR